MDKEGIKKSVLRQLYDGIIKDGPDHQVSLSKFASDNGIDLELMNRVHDELRIEGLLYGVCCTGMIVAPSVKAIIYCENHQLVDQTIIERQNDIRKSILEASVDIYEEKLRDDEYGDVICKRANINLEEFDINAGILVYGNYIERVLHPLDLWKITPAGRSLVRDLRKRRKRLAEFEKLKGLVDITRQARGHRLEDLLAEVIADEEWKVSKRVRKEGAEQDLIFNKDRDYFLGSCKWEKRKVKWQDVSLLLSEAEGAGCYAGVLVSMSGFTHNCIERTKGRKTPQKILLFGRDDVESLFSHAEEIFSDKQWFSDLLDEKIKSLVHKNIILVDGIEF